MVSDDPQLNPELNPPPESTGKDSPEIERPVLQNEPELIEAHPVAEPSEHYYEIRVVTRDLPVRIQYAGIRAARTVLHSSEAAFGLLRGTRSLDALTIDAFELLSADAAHDGVIDPKLTRGDQSVLGFFRTQSNGWPEIQEADHTTTRECFGNGEGLFLLVHSPSHRPWSAELYDLALAGQYLTKDGAHEFYFDEYLLKSGYSNAPPDYDEPEEEVDEPRGNLLSGIGLVAAALVIIGLVGYGVTRWDAVRNRAENLEHARTQTVSQLKLFVRRNGGGDFDISWDHTAPVIEQSNSASLIVADGKLTKTFALEREQLKAGRAFYTPLPLSTASGDIRITLEVNQGNRSQSESMVVKNLTEPLAANEISIYAGKLRTAGGGEASLADSEPAPTVASSGLSETKPTEPVAIVREFPKLDPAAKRALAASPIGSKVFLSVRVAVDENGNVTGTSIVPRKQTEVAVPESLQAAAVDAARLWKYRPGMLKGKAIESESTITFNFQ